VRQNCLREKRKAAEFCFTTIFFSVDSEVGVFLVRKKSGKLLWLNLSLQVYLQVAVFSLEAEVEFAFGC
jgi:hypothetical protein